MLRLRSHPVLSLVLAVLIGLTSVTLGHARGQVRMGDTVVLCTGSGAVAVTLDKDGNPVGPAHVCPDMALTLLAGVAADAPVLPAAVLSGGERLAALSAIPPRPADLPLGEPRGPPSVS